MSYESDSVQGTGEDKYRETDSLVLSGCLNYLSSAKPDEKQTNYQQKETVIVILVVKPGFAQPA